MSRVPLGVADHAVSVGAWRGKVDRIDADGRPFVIVTRNNVAAPVGPCDVLEGPWWPGEVTDVAAGHAHGSGVDLAPGDRVLVVFLEARPNEAVVVGRLRP